MPHDGGKRWQNGYQSRGATVADRDSLQDFSDRAHFVTVVSEREGAFFDLEREIRRAACYLLWLLERADLGNRGSGRGVHRWNPLMRTYLSPSIAVLIGLFAATTRLASAETIAGTVIEDDGGKPIAGVTLLLGNESAVTNREGKFAMTGRGTLGVVASGYRSQTLAARTGMVVRLIRADDEVIVVTDSAPEETKAQEYTMSAEDVRTTPGAMNDALRAITILPAAARIPYSFGGLVLRGMSPRDSSVFIDGVEIPLAFHFGGITGVFPTSLLADMKVMPSGFDVSLGRTQGGAIELQTRTPRRDRYRIGGEVSLLHSAVNAEGPLPAGGAFLVGLRRSYFDVLIRPALSRNDPLPSYTDGQLRAVWGEIPKGGQFTTYVLGALDRLANSEDAAKPNDEDAEGQLSANLGFVRVGASYRRRIDNTMYTVAPFVGTNILSLYSKDYRGTAKADETDIRRRWYQYGGRAEWLRDDPGGFVRAGVDVAGGYLGRVQASFLESGDASDLPIPRNTVLWTDAALWVEARRQWVGDKLSLRPGLRLDRLGLGRQWALDPRLNAHLALTEVSTLRASVGRFHQPPSPAHFDEFVDNLNAKSSYVDQATLSFEAKPNADLTTSVTGFFHEGKKTLVDVAREGESASPIDLELLFRELLEEQIGFYGYQANVGRQRSYGIEGSVRYDAPKYRALANYAWSRAKRKYDPAVDRRWQPYSLDQPLRLNLLFATSAYKWNFGTRLTVVSGNPVRLVPAGTPVSQMDPAKVLVRLPTFWQLDVRVDRMWKKPWGDVRLFFDIQNITNHRNVEFRDNSFDFDPNKPQTYQYDDVLGLPIIPFIGVEIAPNH
jgi:TonB dependent receptor